MLAGPSRIVDVGVDWFTTTAVCAKDATLLLLKGELYTFREAQLGFYRKGWKMSGYSGWRCGRCEYGSREDGAIIRLSSALAASEWWDVYQVTERCSRIDLQVTLKCDEDPTSEILAMRAMTGKFYENRGDGPKITMWLDSENGATIYLGSRRSDLYFRAYNKAAQSKLPEYEGCLRLELEVKNHLALHVIGLMLAAETVQQGILSVIDSYCGNRGIVTNFSSTVLGSLSEPSTIYPDALRSLEFLRRQVAPTVQRLIGLGLTGEVHESLGLSYCVCDCPARFKDR